MDFVPSEHIFLLGVQTRLSSIYKGSLEKVLSVKVPILQVFLFGVHHIETFILEFSGLVTFSQIAFAGNNVEKVRTINTKNFFINYSPSKILSINLTPPTLQAMNTLVWLSAVFISFRFSSFINSKYSKS